MKCNSCESEINPKWKHAIENNICPFCGQIIMDDNLKGLLSNAREIFDELNSCYREELLDWVKQNYNFVPMEVVKKAEIEKKNAVDEEMKNDREKQFFKRAEVKQQPKPATQSKDLRSLASKISEGANADETVMEIDADLEPASDHDLERAKQIIHASYGLSSDPEDEDVPEQIQQLAKLAASPDFVQKDVAKLQNMLAKTKESRDKVVNGGGGKGSFSRAS